MFFCLDGIDGSGKSTQVRLLADALAQRGYDVVVCRDPGSTALGERLREILLHHHGTPIHRRSEMLLYMAARAQLVEEVIRPALAGGKLVLSDRYLLANVVYQGHAGGLRPDDVWQVGLVTVAGILPRWTFVLDLPVARALARVQRPPDRMEAQGLDYLERVRAGFLDEAGRHPERILVIDADRPPAEVHAELVARTLAALAEAP
jgi:dTMP kinase